MNGYVITQNGRVPKNRVGGRHTCFSCENPFYDLNRAIVVCPVCSMDQANRPEPEPEPEVEEGVE
jgi:hypothetical protein